jgi:hypothetical protein
MEKVIGEATPIYLQFTQIAESIYKFNPIAKILVILRNPFDAAYSEYLMAKRLYKDQTISFMERLQKEDHLNSDIFSSPRYIRSRFYDIQLKSYYDVFPSEQIKVSLFEDLKDADNLITSIFEFLEVDTSFKADTSRIYNSGSMVSNSIIHKISVRIPIIWKARIQYIIPNILFRTLDALTTTKTQEDNTSSICPPDAKDFLMPIFRPHILELQKMIGRDLSTWLK